MAKRKKKTDPAEVSTPQIEHIDEKYADLIVLMDTLRLDPQNARDHGPESIAALKASLVKFGQYAPIIVNSADENTILKGNGLFIAAKELGWTRIAARLREFTPEQAKAFALTDNRTAELSTWNDERLTEYLDSKFKTDFADLCEDLKLLDLLPKSPTVVEADKDPVAVVYEVVVGCKNEEDQKRLFERMQGENRKCRLLTM